MRNCEEEFVETIRFKQVCEVACFIHYWVQQLEDEPPEVSS